MIDEGKNILQLTSFRRNDTWYALADVDRQQVYFSASADPLGTNPSGRCQLFSIDRLGSGLRQLTNFSETVHPLAGCAFNRLGLGCAVGGPFWQDPRSRAVLFYSNCNPFGTNLNGGQVFAIQPDGSRLRQLTDSRGLVREAPDVYSVELPGPWAYGPYVRWHPKDGRAAERPRGAARADERRPSALRTAQVVHFDMSPRGAVRTSQG